MTRPRIRSARTGRESSRAFVLRNAHAQPSDCRGWTGCAADTSSSAPKTPDGEFTVIEVECLGACDRAPVVMVNDDWHERLAPDQAGAFVDEIKTHGRAAFTGCHLHVEKKA